MTEALITDLNGDAYLDSAGARTRSPCATLVFVHPALRHFHHRPWPMPRRPWVWRQTWRDLLFAHWPVPAAALRPLVPEGIAIQEFDGVSWVGVVPFRMEGVTARGLPAIPGFSAFAEINVRLYVEVAGRPGVWFVSLDATNRIAIAMARALFHLPYFHATMSCTRERDTIAYASIRSGAARPLAFRASYGPVGKASVAQPGTIEHFLTERYCLFTTARDGSILRADVHHEPWPLQPAEAVIADVTLATSQGIPLDGPPALLHFSDRLDVIGWMPRRAD